MAGVPLQVGNEPPECEGNQVYLPSTSSMMLIWLSEGDRIFGGLSVRGAVERQKQRRRYEWNGQLFLPLWTVYVRLIHSLWNKGGIWENYDNYELLWWINYPHKALNISKHIFVFFFFKLTSAPVLMLLVPCKREHGAMWARTTILYTQQLCK